MLQLHVGYDSSANILYTFHHHPKKKREKRAGDTVCFHCLPSRKEKQESN